MRAKELWRFAPRLHMRTGPEPAVVAPRELMPPGLEKKMCAAFERARAEQIEAQIPEEAAREARDPRTRANSAAFLMLDGERRAIGARLCRPYWRRRDRYRDLILITRLIDLESEHLAGRVGLRDSPSAPHGGSPPRNGDTPAAWTQPWGSGPMVEVVTMFIFYRDQRDRLARRLSARTRARAAGEGARHWNRISSRFQRAIGEWRLELEPEPVGAPKPKRQEAQPRWAQLAGEESTTERARPWAGPRLPRAAAIAATAFVAAGVTAILVATHGGGPSDSASAQSGAVASAPGLSLAALGHISREPRPAQAHGAGHRAHHRSTAHEQTQSDKGAVASAAPQAGGRTALTASKVPPPPPPPAPQAAPAPAPTSAPAPQPQPAPNPKPDPVHSLPTPVQSLPKPGSGSGG